MYLSVNDIDFAKYIDEIVKVLKQATKRGVFHKRNENMPPRNTYISISLSTIYPEGYISKEVHTRRLNKIKSLLNKDSHVHEIFSSLLDSDALDETL